MQVSAYMCCCWTHSQSPASRSHCCVLRSLLHASCCCRVPMQVLLHAPFLERCKQIIAAALAGACNSIQAPLAEALEAAAQREPEPAGHLQPGAWPSVHSPAADKAAAAAAVAALERAASLWAAGSTSLVNSSWGLGGSRALSLQPSGPLKEELAGSAGEWLGGWAYWAQLGQTPCPPHVLGWMVVLDCLGSPRACVLLPPLHKQTT